MLKTRLPKLSFYGSRLDSEESNLLSSVATPLTPEGLQASLQLNWENVRAVVPLMSDWLLFLIALSVSRGTGRPMVPR